VAAGAHVTFLTARDRGQPRREIIDGVDIHRAGGRLGVYPRTAMRLLSRGHNFDAVVDCQNGIPFFAPLFITGIPALQVIHHVHQDQFATALSPPLAALGRVLEACGTRWVYRGRRSVAVSASTRERMRTRLGLAGIIDIVPNGAPTPARLGMRTTDPSLVLVTRLVPHKRVDLLLHAVAAARARLPRLRVEIVGGGPLLEPLRGLANELGLPGVVTLHGRLPAAERDAVLARRG
jgi:glycosyltransferase involved in cell wall biosynthesis